jgi:hypothetical protein
VRQELSFDLKQEEILVIRAALGEVCFGFEISDFNAGLHGSVQEVRDLFDRFERLSDAGEAVEIKADQKTLTILTNAVRETLAELGTEEFHTRTGASVELGGAVLAKLSSMTSGC